MDAALSAGPDRYYVQFALNEILVGRRMKLCLGTHMAVAIRARRAAHTRSERWEHRERSSSLSLLRLLMLSIAGQATPWHDASSAGSGKEEPEVWIEEEEEEEKEVVEKPLLRLTASA
eukprot:752376-Hanusia_phi.AAC.1